MDTETQASYKELQRIASRSETTTYDTIGQLAGLPAYDPRLFDILEHISRAEVSAGRPMLAALVVSPDEGIPGNEFFRLARVLSRVHFGERDWDFWRRERDSVHKHWSNNHPAVASAPG